MTISNPTTKDAGGYMGDWSRGAPLGRPDTLHPGDDLITTRPTYYECGLCGAHHDAWWDGDCRQDDARHDPDQLDREYGSNGWDEIAMQDVDKWRARNGPKFQLQKVRLNGDYDQGGAYWGCHSRGSILYVAFTDSITLYMRAADREAARKHVLDLYSNARFYR